jgi:DNA/RNA endonuclease YhcR with UshA esterase domain
MLGRQERLALLLLIGVAVAVIAAHFVLTTVGKQPFASPYSVTSADGELVHVSGAVDQVTLTKEGDYAIIRMGNTTVFTPSPYIRALGIQKGDRISVYGIVQTYHGKKEIVVNSADDLHRIPGD